MNPQGRLWTAAALLVPLAIAAQDRFPAWHQKAVVNGLTESSAFDPVQVLANDEGYVFVDRDRRVYTDAQLTPLRQARNYYPVRSAQRLELLPDDALLYMNQPPDPYCGMARIGRAGTLDWIASTIETGCSVVSVDRFGTMFAGDFYGVQAHTADGRITGLQQFTDAQLWSTSTHALFDGGALVFTQMEAGPPEIHAYSAQLGLLGSWPIMALDQASQAWWTTTWASNHAQVVLAATTADKLRILRVDPHTAESWSVYAGDLLPEVVVLGLAMDQGGRISALLRDNRNDMRLLQIASDGSTRFLSSAPDAFCSYFRNALLTCALTSVGEQTYWIKHDVSGPARLYRVSGNDEPQLIQQIERPIGKIAFGHDGSIVAITANALGWYTDFDDAPNRQIIRIGPEPTDGITMHSPLVAEGNVEPTHAQYLHLDGGDVLEMTRGHVDYFVLATSRKQPWSMRRIRGDGQVSWRRDFVDEGYYFDFAKSATQACTRVHGSVAAPNGAGGRLRCLDVEDGALVMDRAIDGAIFPNLPTLVTDTPGKVFLSLRANSEGNTPEQTKLMLLEGDADARLVALTDASAVHALGADGRLAVVYGGEGAKKLLQVDAVGKAGAEQAFLDSIRGVSSLAFDAEDQLWMTFAFDDGVGPRIARIGNEAQFVDAYWPAVLGSRIEQVIPTAQGRLVLMGQNFVDFSGVRPLTGAVLLGSDGTLRWQYWANAQELDQIYDMAVMGGRVQLLGWKNSAAYLADLDLATGLKTRQVDLPLPYAYNRFGSGLLPTVRLDAPDHVWTAHRRPGRVVLGEASVAPGRVIETMAPALAGAWQLGELSGQGLVLAYHPENRTLSGAWFSHDTTYGDNDHAALRWNTLIGTVAPGATSVSMTLHENRGGAFDAGPVTSATVVGQATLTVSGCDHASLRYEFSDGRALPRTVALTRASPRTVDCTPQGEAATPAAYTPRSDLAGAWYQPATSGQGLHIAVYPGVGPSSEAPETLGLGWFTYDPAAAADDATQQHWFTASGRFNDLSQASANLTIYRTTGGDRDRHATYNTHAVGTATLTRIDCDSATLSYQFSATALAAAYAGRAGTIALSRLGGCATH